MRRLSGVLLAGAMLLLPAFSQSALRCSRRPPRRNSRWTATSRSGRVSIRPDKTADYEQIMGKVKEALAKSEAPEAKQQLAGWKVIKSAKPHARWQHRLHARHHSRVPEADYIDPEHRCTRCSRIRRSRRRFYDQYRGALNAATCSASARARSRSTLVEVSRPRRTATVAFDQSHERCAPAARGSLCRLETSLDANRIHCVACRDDERRDARGAQAPVPRACLRRRPCRPPPAPQAPAVPVQPVPAPVVPGAGRAARAARCADLHRARRE